MRPGAGLSQPGQEPPAPTQPSFRVEANFVRVDVYPTNAKGEHPKDRPLTPNDLWATVYRHLGIDYDRSFPDYRGRPMPILPYGSPIDELTV